MSGLGLDLKGLEFKDFVFEVFDFEFKMLSFSDEFFVLGFGLFDDFVDLFDFIVESLHFTQEFDIFLLCFSQFFCEGLALLEGLIEEMFVFLLFFE
jgi:hypothetical protein